MEDAAADAAADDNAADDDRTAAYCAAAAYCDVTDSTATESSVLLERALESPYLAELLREQESAQDNQLENAPPFVGRAPRRVEPELESLHSLGKGEGTGSEAVEVYGRDRGMKTAVVATRTVVGARMFRGFAEMGLSGVGLAKLRALQG